MAVRVETEGGDLVVRLRGLSRLWGFAREVRVPLADVVAVRVRPRREVVRRARVMRVCGTGVPGVVNAGWHGWFGKGLQFWYVGRGDRVLDVELRPARRLRRIVVQVDDPDEVAARLAAVSPA